MRHSNLFHYGLLMLLSIGSPHLAHARELPTGEATVSVPVVNISPEEARAQAIRLAKEQILRATVGEELITSESLLTAGENQQLSALSELSSRGGIVAVELLEDRMVMETTPTAQIPTYRIRMRATVQRYHSVADPSFTLRIEGVKATGYVSGEPLQFSLTPTDSCYLSLFLFDATGAGAQLYPNSYEPPRPFSAGKTVTFPTNQAIQYTLEIGQKGASEEVNTLYMVQTRQPVVYTSSEPTFEQVHEWMSRLEPNQRNLVTIPVRIVTPSF